MKPVAQSHKCNGGSNGRERPSVCGVILYPGSKEPDIYLLYFCDGEPIVEDTPLVDEQGKILFCTNPELLPIVHKMGAPELVKLGPFRKKPIYVYNLCEVFRVTNAEEEGLSSSHIVIDTLILLLDCLQATANAEEYDDVLSPLFCTLFENGSVKSFFKKYGFAKEQVFNSLIGAIGHIAKNSRLIKEKPKQT